MADVNVKKMPIAIILDDSLSYFKNNLLQMTSFSLFAYFLAVVALYSWKTIWFWPFMLVVYILWSAFFRFYFKRQPYFSLRPIMYSMVPSTKILVLGVVIITILIALPFVPLFLPISPDWIDDYALFLQHNMQESDVVDAVLNLVVIILSPFLFYRPALAWIAAITGRSGSLRFAWSKTKGNYWEFLLMAIIIDLSSVLFYKLILILGGNIAVALIFLAPLTIYFNVALAKVYSFFFLE